MKTTIGSFTFDSDFDSGNMLSVQQSSHADGVEDVKYLSKGAIAKSADAPSAARATEIQRYCFDILTKHDGMDANIVTNYRTWFYYSVEYMPIEAEMNNFDTTIVQFRIKNINRVMKLFGMGFKPVFRHESDTNWRRIFSKPSINTTQSGMDLNFSFAFTHMDCSKRESLGSIMYPAQPGKYFFAYCAPYSYTDLQNRLINISKAFESPMRNAKKSRIPLPKSLACDIYFHRDVLTKTRLGRNLDILTISSMDNIDTDPEPHIEGLYPVQGTKRSKKFQMGQSVKYSKCKNLMGKTKSRKSVIFVSARVHPGETISSFIMDGFIDFLLSNDHRARILRSMFVFKIVPMLNPDGVALGNYRGDDLGENLNRVYHEPSETLHPTIWAVKRYIELTDNLSWYFDLHGHANKPGTFILANWVSDRDKQYETMLFTQCLYHNINSFDLKECDFESTAKASSLTLSKEGTGRVAISRMKNLHHCYTFEANYYGTKYPKRTNNCSKSEFMHDKHFSLHEMKNMGKEILASVLNVEYPEATINSLNLSAKEVIGIHTASKKMQNSLNEMRTDKPES